MACEPRTSGTFTALALLRRISAPLSALGVAAILIAAADPGPSVGQEAPPSPPRRTGPHLKNPAESQPRVLVFSKTAGFRHGSIPTGVEALREIGRKSGYRVEATEDSSWFRPDMLSRFQAVVFLNTTGDVLNDEQQRTFEAFIRNGGGYVGVHSAADTEYDWPWYGRLVGGWFKTHPAIQRADINVENRRFPATSFLPETWSRTDEWYVYRDNPRPRVNVLLSLDESTYKGGGMNGDHPIAWYQDFDGGRAFYTGGGHTNDSYAEPLFRRHLGEAIMWAAGERAIPTDKGAKATPKTDNPENTNR